MPVTDRMFDDPWRVRCPYGHPNPRPLDHARMAYCKRCRRTYTYEQLHDAKERASHEGWV